MRSLPSLISALLFNQCKEARKVVIVPGALVSRGRGQRFLS